MEHEEKQADAEEVKARARAGRAALAAMLAPVRARTRLAMGLQIVGAAATVVPYIAIAELAKALLAPGPTDEGDVRRAVPIAVFGLSVRAPSLTRDAVADAALAEGVAVVSMPGVAARLGASH
ncbi:hypothetical protein [Streptomyces cyaneofuscatus]